MTLFCPRCREYRPINEMKESKDGIWYCKVRCEVPK
jgi:hypothetical protein